MLQKHWLSIATSRPGSDFSRWDRSRSRGSPLTLTSGQQVDSIFLAPVSGTCATHSWHRIHLVPDSEHCSILSQKVACTRLWNDYLRFIPFQLIFGYNTRYNNSGHLGKFMSKSFSATFIFVARNFPSRCIRYEKPAPENGVDLWQNNTNWEKKH